MLLQIVQLLLLLLLPYMSGICKKMSRLLPNLLYCRVGCDPAVHSSAWNRHRCARLTMHLRGGNAQSFEGRRCATAAAATTTVTPTTTATSSTTSAAATSNSSITTMLASGFSLTLEQGV